MSKQKSSKEKIDKRIEQLFKLNAHLGHKSNRIHPRAKKYIYRMERGVSIIDLLKTVALLDEAKKFVSQLAQNLKTILFVATKKNVAALTQEICEANNLPYITVKWPAGFLTNFETLLKNIKKLNQMKEDEEKGAWNKFVKHEQLKLKKQLSRLEKFYAGVASIEKLPDAIFVIDIKKENTAIAEALKINLPTIAIVDTNVDPEKITYPIPANDDSAEAVEYIIREIVEAYTSNKKDTEK